MAIAAAEAGAKGIFMEKPFVRTRAEADSVIAACRKAGAKLGLSLLGRGNEEVRLPLLPVQSEANRAFMKSALVHAGLLNR
jgi:dihydrodipicolinate synthase/N-acetylneuraminate lyase